MIALLGATGYTGNLIARALDRQNHSFCLVGRSEEKLRALSFLLESKPEFCVVNNDYTQFIDKNQKQIQLIINCVGPFSDLGERVVRDAAVSGIHYLDISNELGYIYRLSSYSRLAENARALLVPSCAFEVALADCAAGLLSETFPGQIEEVRVIYDLPGNFSSRGTRKSALRSLATSWIAYQNGRWVGEAPCSRSAKATISGKRVNLISFPSSESAVIPTHIQTKTVSTWLAVTPVIAAIGPIIIPHYARFLRSIAGPWIQKSIRPTSKNSTGNSNFKIHVSAREGNSGKGYLVSGTNPYMLTANIVAHAVSRILGTDNPIFGLLPPSKILGTSGFFEQAKAWGVNLDETD